MPFITRRSIYSALFQTWQKRTLRSSNAKPRAHRQPKQRTCPDGGIGRRAGLKHQWSNPCRFDPGSGYQTKCKCLIFKHLHFSFCFLHHACTTEWAVLGQKLCFSKKISVGPVSFVCLGAKLVKVGVNRKNIKTQHEDISLLILLSGSLLILLFSIIQTNLRLFSHTYNIF